MSVVEKRLEERNDFIGLHEVLTRMVEADGSTYQKAAEFLSQLMLTHSAGALRMHVHDWPMPPRTLDSSDPPHILKANLEAVARCIREAIEHGNPERSTTPDGKPLEAIFERYGFRRSKAVRLLEEQGIRIEEDPPKDTEPHKVSENHEQELAQWKAKAERLEKANKWYAKQAQAITPATPDYLDPNHPRYAPKLAAAVQAWLAVTDPGKKTPKTALKEWLQEHAGEYKGLTSDGEPLETPINQCAKVANWEPEGGAPKTPGG